MKKFALNLLVLFILASFVLSACGAAPTEAPVAAVPEGEVAIVAWPGYIERGANEPADDRVTAFEMSLVKVTVNVNAHTSDEMVSLMSSVGMICYRFR